MLETYDLYSEAFNENDLQRSYNYFNHILGYPQPLITEEEILQEKLNNERQKVISVDCLRTRSSLFDKKIKDDLEILLTHYCRVKELKYKQGLNEIAAPFIHFRKIGIPISQCEALFNKFFSSFSLNFYYDDNFHSIELFIKMFSVVLKYHDPALTRYLEFHNIEPQLFCINWLMTFFASKLSLKMVYELWMFIASEKDKFFIFFLVLAILEINRENIIQSKNTGILQVVTNLIFKDEPSFKSVIERALLLRKNTPNSIVLFFRDRMVFEKTNNFGEIALLLEHMEKLNLFMILPGELTLDEHSSNGICEKDCYFCDLRKPLPEINENCSQEQAKIIEISNDVRSMNYMKEYVIMDLRLDKGKDFKHKGIIFEVRKDETIGSIEERFLAEFIEEKGKKHFVFVLTRFSFEELTACNQEELSTCKKIIHILNSLSFPLVSILEGGFEAYAQNKELFLEKQKKCDLILSEDLVIESEELPYSFPLKISDRFLMASAFCNDEAATFVGLVEVLIVLEYFILILPIEDELKRYINYFEHNRSPMQYLYERTNIPKELLVHKVISIKSLKKASMKIHNQNVLVLQYDSCEHQEKRIFSKISNYLDMDIVNFMKVGEICKKCKKTKSKIVLEMETQDKVKECANVLTKKYIEMRNKIKQSEEHTK